MPAGAALACRALGAAAVTFAGSAAVALAAPLVAAPALAPAGVPCPPAHANKTNDCDCSFEDPAAGADAIVFISSAIIDSGFSSFHCYLDGTNVCAFGANTGMLGAGGSCAFVLPAGEEYSCSMEWGATSFPATFVANATRSIFTSGGGSGRAGDRSLASARDKRLRLARAAAPAPAARPDEARVERLWAAWREQHGRVYASAEEAARRRANFALHVAAADDVVRRGKIGAHPHLDGEGRQARFNHFADLSRSEWEALHRRRAVPAAPAAPAVAAPPTPTVPPPPPPPPPPFDWATKGVVTPVKDQGQCGSCWSFSTTGAIESAWAVAGNPLVSLSEQLLVSCDNTSYGCDGGFPNTAMDWVRDNGEVTEASYPYVSGNGSSMDCAPNGRVAASANVTGFQAVPGNTSLAVEAELGSWLAAFGPVSILVDDMTQLWWTYVGGVMKGCCDVATNHAVLLTGYDSNATEGAWWIIKNSWSQSWGEAGYVWLQRGDNECGIGTFPTIPSVSGGKLPPPPPPPPPRPLWQCPADAFAANNSLTARCEWRNNTNGGVMPTSVGDYCLYFNDGYMGYTFDGKLPESAYPCWPSFGAGGDGGAAWFCTLSQGANGFSKFPPGATANCSGLAEGVIAYEWPL